MPRNVVIELLLELIGETLNAFPQHLQTIEGYDETASELILNSEFSHTLQLACGEKGYRGCTFHDESASQEDLVGEEKKHGIPPRIDIGIRLAQSAGRIMLIEGKRLHDQYDRQYVSGKTGGITRFKTEQHGADVEVACMVGYVQTNTFPFWYGKINGWIDAEVTTLTTAIWNVNDRLQAIAEKASHLAHCESTHARTKRDPIKLHHFWVKVI